MIDRPHLYIDGDWVTPSGADVITVDEAATEEVIGTVPNLGVAETRRALEAAATLQAGGISAEVIDPRTLRPLDLEQGGLQGGLGHVGVAGLGLRHQRVACQRIGVFAADQHAEAADLGHATRVGPTPGTASPRNVLR